MTVNSSSSLRNLAPAAAVAEALAVVVVVVVALVVVVAAGTSVLRAAGTSVLPAAAVRAEARDRTARAPFFCVSRPP